MGCSIHIEEVTLNPFLTSEVSDFNFSNADIRPGEYLVNDTAEASAKHSLFRDIENCKSLAANGASINNNNGSINSTAPNGLLFEFESLLDFPPPKNETSQISSTAWLPRIAAPRAGIFPTGQSAQ